MPPDAPNPDADGHEHLFQPHDVAYALRLRDEPHVRTIIIRACEVCGRHYDLRTGQPPRDLDVPQ